ncbi:spermidine synthase [Rothia kristinae]|uniref:Spermidine synthase n=1 Tax=Rothia kristinae TaxID=37923 RepID=A0A199NR93_9MICC|nr:fused MFS/spermidine synthase [Rothia kristinae]OAX51614.1 hypothetical protein AN277_0207955 [Rothia kristinae]
MSVGDAGEGPQASVQLSFSGAAARVRPDGWGEGGVVLEIDGAEQSHVIPAHPERIRYEYLRRIAHLGDLIGEPGEPIAAAHLGAGALTLLRYVQATRPGSAQVAVEIERELPGFITRHLPLPPGTDLRVVIDDVRAALPGLRSAAGMGSAQGFDLVVVDIFAGADSPAHLACRDFYAEALAQLGSRGILAVNVGDDPPLDFFVAQAAALDEAAADAGLPGPWTLADAGMLTGRRPGNLILAAGPGLGEEHRSRLEAAGPDPVRTRAFRP